MPLRMKTALAAWEAWAESVIPTLESVGDKESADVGRDRIEQSENARTTIGRAAQPAPDLDPAVLAHAVQRVGMMGSTTAIRAGLTEADYIAIATEYARLQARESGGEQ